MKTTCQYSKDAIESLKSAMIQAKVPQEHRADLIGFFCNEWNRRVEMPRDEQQAAATQTGIDGGFLIHG